MSEDLSYDDAVIGAGVIGLAHAYHLARRGRRVIVFERNDRACGASVRNFGMLWPIGQPFGALRSLAGRSLEIWLDILEASGLWHERTGSLHLAYRDDEAQVLREFAGECEDHGERVELIGPSGVRERAPAVRTEGLQLALVEPSRSLRRSARSFARLAGLAFAPIRSRLPVRLDHHRGGDAGDLRGREEMDDKAALGLLRR